MVDVHHMVTIHQIKKYIYGGHSPFMKVFLWWMATIKNMTMVEIHHIFCDSYKVNYCQANSLGVKTLTISWHYGHIQKKYGDRFDPKMTKKCEGQKFLEK